MSDVYPETRLPSSGLADTADWSPLTVSQGDAPSTEDPPPTIEGYEILGRLGAGGMGVVCAARQLGTHRQVALKLLGGRSMDQAGRARFAREVELASRLTHPNIARIYDSGLHEGRYYYAMELIEGSTLDTYVLGNRLDCPKTLELMRIICQAVQHAHNKGVIHRDLKPSNIVVGNDGQPHVLDFGLAKAIAETDVSSATTTVGRVEGTLAYMSPEQADGRTDHIDTRSDVYSLGKIIYLFTAGQPAHNLDGSSYAVQRRVVEEEVRRPRRLRRCRSRA